MAIVRWEPFGDVWNLRRSMDRVFDDYFTSPTRTGDEGMRPAMAMPIDVFYTDDALVVKGNMPGVKPDDVDITVTGNALNIKAETKLEQDAKEENYIFRERRFSSYSRSMTLPDDVDPSKIEAAFDDGVLTLTVPKSEEKKPKQIKIKATKQIEGK
jgi:HSP20 family protein